MPKNKNSFIERLNSKYVFSVRNDDKFLESAKATLSVYELVILLFLATLLSLLFAFLMFRYTNLKHFVMNDGNQQKKEIVLLTGKADSLENVLLRNEAYFENINRVLTGNGFIDGTNVIDSQNLRSIEISEPSEEELALREQVQDREQFSLSNANQPTVNFSNPIEGIVTNRLDIEEQHFGIDLVAPKNTPVLASANGIIIYSSWSDKDGHILIISHENDYISIYKHNEKALKKVGERVSEGDAIAIIGNSGENTSGYHLHFELWKDGIPLNPTEYLTLN